MLPSHVHRKIWPCSIQFWLGFLASAALFFLDTLCGDIDSCGVVSKFVPELSKADREPSEWHRRSTRTN